MGDFTECPECGRRYEVNWVNDGQGPPEYCPMCGAYVEPNDEEDDDG